MAHLDLEAASQYYGMRPIALRRMLKRRGLDTNISGEELDELFRLRPVRPGDPPPVPDVAPVVEVAGRLGCSRTTVMRLVEQNGIPTYARARDRRVWVSYASVEEMRVKSLTNGHGKQAWRDLVAINDAAVEWECHPRMIWKFVADAPLSTFHRVGDRRTFIDRRELSTYLESRQRAGTVGSHPTIGRPKAEPVAT